MTVDQPPAPSVPATPESVRGRINAHYRQAQLHADLVKWQTRTATPELQVSLATYHILAALTASVRDLTTAIREGTTP